MKFSDADKSQQTIVDSGQVSEEEKFSKFAKTSVDDWTF
jgi:hypothetical protein